MSIIGRVALTDGFEVAETGEATLELSGREAWPTTLGRAEVIDRHTGVLGLRGALVQVQLTPKSERNGYYTVSAASSTLTDIATRSGFADWKLTLQRHGHDSQVDLESRLAGAVRANDFSLAGERWHAPPIGHYGYYTGSTVPSMMTRTGEDGTITVYRGVPAGVSPRWGCPVGSYMAGRCRILGGFPGREVTGVGQRLPASQWEIGNGLVRARYLFTSGSLEVGSYTGGWRPKVWQVDIGGGPIISWDAATILRNDPEATVVRLTESRAPGRVVLDLTVRRGSRVVEGYLQRGDSGAISVYLATAETLANNTSYLVRSTDDADGNQVTCGSAKTFTPHANGGLTKTSVAALDFFLGVVAGQPVLNANPYVESGLTGWHGVGGIAAQSGDFAHQGTQSIKFTPNGSSATVYVETQSPLVNAVLVTPGVSYVGSAWIYCAPGYASVNIALDWYSAAGSLLSTSQGAASALPAATWTWYSVTGIAPVGAALAGLRPIRMTGTPAASIVTYSDEAKIRLATPAGDQAVALRDHYIGAMPETTGAVRR